MNKDKFFRYFVCYLARLLRIEMFLSTNKGISANIVKSDFLSNVYEDFILVAKRHGFKVQWYKRF